MRMKSIVAGMLAGVMLLTATPALAAEESAEQVAVTAAKPLSTEQRIADLENELKELKAMYTKDKTVHAKKDKDAADRLQFKGSAQGVSACPAQVFKGFYNTNQLPCVPIHIQFHATPPETWVDTEWSLRADPCFQRRCSEADCALAPIAGIQSWCPVAKRRCFPPDQTPASPVSPQSVCIHGVPHQTP